MFESLLVLALLTVTDPAGDTAGAGALQPPTAPVFRSLAPFDLREVRVAEGETLALEVELGSLANPFDLELGFSLPILEIYVGGDEGGLEELLPGSGMELPPGERWNVAVQVTGDGARALHAAGGAAPLEAVPAVSIAGGVLRIETPFPTPERPRLFALTGLYDPFHPDGWRPLAQGPAPWAFSSTDQLVPVVDVLAPDGSAQERALLSGVLPPPATVPRSPDRVWFVLMGAGLVLALAGLLLRLRARTVTDRAAREETYVATEGTAAAAASPAAIPSEGSAGSAPGALAWDTSALLLDEQDGEPAGPGALPPLGEWRPGGQDEPAGQDESAAHVPPVRSAPPTTPARDELGEPELVTGDEPPTDGRSSESGVRAGDDDAREWAEAAKVEGWAQADEVKGWAEANEVDERVEADEVDERFETAEADAWGEGDARGAGLAAGEWSDGWLTWDEEEADLLGGWDEPAPRPDAGDAGTEERDPGDAGTEEPER